MEREAFEGANRKEMADEKNTVSERTSKTFSSQRQSPRKYPFTLEV
jgi:hypothetical protein